MSIERNISYTNFIITCEFFSFDCVFDETDRPGGELITFKMFYHLEDDTISIKELKSNQEGRDCFSMFLKKAKLPKNWKKKQGEDI